MSDDPCDDWWPHWLDYRPRLLRLPTGTDYNPQFDLCDDCQHWVKP